MDSPGTDGSGTRLAEIIAALSLAIDLALGVPMEQSLRSCLLAVRLGEELGLDEDDLTEVYDVALLRMVGCTSDSHLWAVSLLAFPERYHLKLRQSLGYRHDEPRRKQVVIAIYPGTTARRRMRTPIAVSGLTSSMSYASCAVPAASLSAPARAPTLLYGRETGGERNPENESGGQCHIELAMWCS